MSERDRAVIQAQAGARPNGRTYDEMLRSAFAAGMRTSAVATNEQVDHAFAEWKRGFLP